MRAHSDFRDALVFFVAPTHAQHVPTGEAMGGSSSKIAAAAAEATATAMVDARVEKMEAEIERLGRELAAARKPMEEIQAADEAARVA